jgi:alcohol dehydrogenase class IV
LKVAGALPDTLSKAGVPQKDLSMLARAAAEQWTGRFNPRPLDVAGAEEIYRGAY